MKIVAMLLAAVLVLAGCGSSTDDEPASGQTKTAEKVRSEGASADGEPTQAEAGVVVDIGLYSGRESTPQGERVNAKVGQKITLRVTSAVDEELHVHSDPEHTFTVKPGKNQLFTFTVDTPGQVAVEAHHAGVTLVQLVVRP